MSEQNECIEALNARIDMLEEKLDFYKDGYLRLSKELDKYPCKTVVGNNSVVYSKSADDYDRLISCIKAEAVNDYSELITDNGIVILPCKVNDILYVIPTEKNKLSEITEMKCVGFILGKPADTINLIDKTNKLYQPGFGEYNKTVFGAKILAEIALDKLNRE